MAWYQQVVTKHRKINFTVYKTPRHSSETLTIKARKQYLRQSMLNSKGQQ